MKKAISYFLLLILILNSISPYLVYADEVPNKSQKGKELNKFYYENYGFQVYGDHDDVKESHGNDFDRATGQWRYLGYTFYDQPFSNEKYPNIPGKDEDWSTRNWVEEPWEDDQIKNKYKITETDWSGKPEFESWIKDSIKWSVNGGDNPVFYFHVQSPSRTFKQGSIRGWHRASDGKLYYKTFITKPLGEEQVLDTPFKVETSILSSDFTIDEDESTVEIDVNVKGILEDEAYVSDKVETVKHYTREDIKEWYIKLEYEDQSEYIKIDTNGSNTADNTFKVKLNRSEVSNGKKITFTGAVRTVFYNGRYYRDSDPKEQTITVKTSPIPVELPPDVSISSPSISNVNESYTVEVIPYIPHGESLSSIRLERSLGGGSYVNLGLNSNKATESYSSEGTVNYRATVTLTNGKSQVATSTTHIVDLREATAEPKLELPKFTYEGHWITGYNRSRFYYEGKSYSPQKAKDEGIGDSDWEFYDESKHYLDKSEYDTRNKDGESSIDMKFNNPGDYKVGIIAEPKNGVEREDVKSVQVLRTPAIDAETLGSKKSNRRQTVRAKINVNPDYPLDYSKLYIEIRDKVTNEKVMVTTSSHPDSTNIKTKNLSIQSNIYDVVLTLDYLIKTTIDKDYEITIYVKDTRGENDTKVKNIRVRADKSPVGSILAPDVIYRNRNGIASIKITKDGHSLDGDFLKLNNLRYKVDTDNDGSFSDERFINLSSNLLEKQVNLKVDKVGRILLDYEIQEDLSPSTIPEFVTDSDYLKTHVTKVINVDNLAPHTSLRLINNEKIDMLVIGRERDKGLIQSEIEKMKSSLNTGAVVVDNKGSVVDANMDNKLIDIKSVNVPYIPEYGLTATHGIGDDYYYYFSPGANMNIRRFDDLSYLKVVNGFVNLSGSYTKTVWEIDGNNVYYIKDNGGKNTFYHLNLDTNALYSQDYAGPFTKKEYNVEWDKFNIIMTGNYIYDIESNQFVRFTLSSETGPLIGRKENKLYFLYTEKRKKYKLQSLNIDTGEFKVVDEYIHDTSMKYSRGSIYRQVSEDKIVFLEPYYASRLKFVTLDLNTEKFTHEGDIQAPGTFVDNEVYKGKSFSPYEFRKFHVSYDEINDTYYFQTRTWYRYIRKGRVYWWVKDFGYKVKNGVALVNNKLLYEIGLRYPQEVDDRDEREYHDLKRYYYNGNLYKLRRYGRSWRHGYHVYNTNYDHLSYHRIEGDMSGLDDQELIEMHGDGRRSDYLVWYRVEEDRNDDRYDQFKRKFARELGQGDRWLISYKTNHMWYRIFEDSKGTKWAMVWPMGIWGYYGIIRQTYVVNLETNEVYESNIFDSGSRLKVFMRNDKIWLFSDIRNGYFDTKTLEFKELEKDIVKGDVFSVIHQFFQSETEEHLHMLSRPDKLTSIKFYDSFKDNVVKEISNFNPRSKSQKYIVILADTATSLTSEEINEISNLIKAKGAKCIWLGNSNNYSTGYSIASKTGGQYYNHSNISNGFITLKNYLSYRLPKKEELYTTKVKAGEEVSYDMFYYDLENDLQIPSTVRWYYRKQGGSSWSRSTPQTVFSPGVYYASWGVMDNPRPANTSSRFSAYRKNAIREEMQIIVGNVDPPVEIIDTEIGIEIDGSLKVNREVKFSVDITPGTKELDYSTLDISFNDSSNVFPSTTSTTEFSKIFKVAKTYNVTASIRDVGGKTYSKTVAFTIAVDSPITLDVSLTPSKSHRDKEGKAYFDVTVNADSTDDYIESIKHYLDTDNDNDGKFDDELSVELTAYENLREFTLEINDGVGKYRLRTEAVEGFNEPTLDTYITDLDYHRANVSNDLEIDNYIPMLEFGTDKEVYLVGEEIKYISSFDDTELSGDITKAYYDIEDDEIDKLEVKYIQDKTVMPSQDLTSSYHNISRTELLNSLDRAGEYKIESFVVDSPKPSNSKFDSYKKESNQNSNTITLHYRPKAELSFISSHAGENNFDFGYNQYLEGTELKIIDTSSDPDGFDVTSQISYKINSGSYNSISSGDNIKLQYGNIYTIKVTTEDNFGAADTELYTIKVINDLDMIPDINPNPIAASEDVTLSLRTNQYATCARAVIFGTNVDLDIKSESSTEKIWETKYGIPKTQKDNTYEVEFYATGEGLVELQENKDLIVKTPINLLAKMPSELTIDTPYIIGAKTTKYADEVTVNIFKGEAFEDTITLDSISFSEEKTWNKEYIVPVDVPKGYYFAEFIARTENGNIESVIVPIKTVSIKLENFRISEIRDYSWENYFIEDNGNLTELSRSGIQVSEMPVYKNKEGQGIKLGYKLYFKIDSMGLNDAGDIIEISPSFYALNDRGKPIEADIYVEDDNTGDYKLLKFSKYDEFTSKITLDTEDRFKSESEPANLSKNTWNFKYYIPPTAKIVEKSKALDLVNDNTKKYKLLVVFDILGRKNNGAEFNYTEKEIKWPSEEFQCSYGKNRPTTLNLTGYGYNHGEIFYYYLRETLIDDLKFNREW